MKLADFRYDPSYRKSCTLWIFSPVKKHWIQVGSLNGVSFQNVPCDLEDPVFVKGSRSWLHLGAFWFESGEDPNTQNPLSPIVLPPELLTDLQIIQHNLMSDDPLSALNESRNLTANSLIDQTSNKVNKLKEQAQQLSVLPVDRALIELQDWKPKENYLKLLNHPKLRKKIMESEDGTMIKLL